MLIGSVTKQMRPDRLAFGGHFVFSNYHIKITYLIISFYKYIIEQNVHEKSGLSVDRKYLREYLIIIKAVEVNSTGTA